MKAIENSKCDIIALMNEFAMICDRKGIDIDEVLADLNTKWNALGLKPELVGDHCIGVDPYYLINVTERLSPDSQITLKA